MNKSIADLTDNLKAYSVLSVANRHIPLTPGITRNLKTYIQLARDCIRVETDSFQGSFAIDNTAELI